MYMRKCASFALTFVLVLPAALACGPFFPQSLLDNRKSSLLDMPEGTFAYEAAHLLPTPDDHLRVVEDGYSENPVEQRVKAQAQGLSDDEFRKVEAMRTASGADATATAGKGLAPELFNYALGAIAFKAGNTQVASEHFRRVIALSPVDRPRRGLWALYMLGRTEAANGNTDGAIAAFGQLRKHAVSGEPDPLGLAVASLGEQARVHWHHGNIAAAVALYAQQAAHGSVSGNASLLFVARGILAHPDLLDKALDDLLAQRLLAAYFYTRSAEFAQNWPPAGTQVNYDDTNGDADANTSSTSVSLEGFLAAVQKHGLDHFDGADRMAAGAYQVGRYALAAQLAAKSTAPMAAWVRAKLALRAGDQATAMREYAAAAKGFPIDERWGEDASDSGAVQSPVCRVESERGVLALSRGEYVDAMARLYAGSADYWPDAAYVAERVLTADELKNFVDRNAPIAPKLVRSEIDGGTPIPPGTQLRALLARRLLRVGRDDEAMRYFDDPALHAKAAALVAARHPGMTWTNIGRAKNLFKQAQLTRADGLELLGTELAPDYAMEDGEYALGNVPLQPKDFVGTGEPVRVNASAPAPDARYHYRYVAADLAEQAAALIPVRSQAYAALMCQATAWMSDTEEKRAASLYRRYLHEGAWVAWGKDFGRSCPPPDFASARWVPLKQHYRALRHWTKHGWPLLLGGLGLLVILVAAIRNRRGRSDAE